MVAGDPDALVKVSGRNDSALEGWAENDHLQLLNLTYVSLSVTYLLASIATVIHFGFSRVIMCELKF